MRGLGSERITVAVTTNHFIARIPKAGLCDLLSVCVSVYSNYQLLNEPVSTKLRMYIKGPDPISVASLPSLCESVCVCC
jgi:hypothetical protein